MSKKFYAPILGSLVLGSLFCPLEASTECPRVCPQDIPRPDIEFKAGYFFFTSSPMRKVFNQGGIDLQLCGVYPLCSNLGLYAAVEYMGKYGHTLGAHEKTSIWEIPLSLGLQPIVGLNDDNTIRYYFTIGPKYFFAQVTNHSSGLPHRLSSNNIGGFANTGFMYDFCDYLSLDVFGEYSYVKLRFHSSKKATKGHTVQAGGLTFGLGLAYLF